MVVVACLYLSWKMRCCLSEFVWQLVPCAVRLRHGLCRSLFLLQRIVGSVVVMGLFVYVISREMMFHNAVVVVL